MGGLKWINIGCGRRAITALITELCSPTDVVWIYLSDAQIKIAQNHPFTKPVNFQTGGATALPSEADTFNLATMALVLFFILKTMLGVSEMMRVIRDGGSVSAYECDILGNMLPI